ncbi:MAG: hypothetical protein KAT25_05685 [Sulfuriflexus sp.]|nr:hypothetical protein [Sulfuriflexus sp.]
MQKIRLFVSSPIDVAAERRRVDNVVNRIKLDYEGVEFEVIRWEEAFYTARSTFQDQIASPADVDIVLCILWKRLGSPLPDDYQRDDGSTPTGTEYEFETAMEAALSGELPDILVYRKTAAISFNAEHVDQEQAELQSLESFWRRWIQNEKGHFTAGFKPFADTDEFEQQLEKDLRAWLKRRFHHVTWPESKGSPYRGLDVFDEEHAAIYFGRRRAINEVRARLLANQQRDGIGFLLIIGASGAGKSSLVRAGLIPALKETNPIEGVAGWRTLVVRPAELGTDPVHGLVTQLYEHSVLPELAEGDYSQPRELSDLWKSSPAMASKPVDSALKRWGKVLAAQEQMTGTADTRLLITIDQFEELFQFDTEQQVSFLNVIDSLSRSGKIWIIATMRSDFYPQLFSLPELMNLKDASRQYDLSIPRPHELQEIITGPALAAGLSFEQDIHAEGLEQRLLEDAEGNPGALPLLEFTLERLYQERDRDNKQLTFKAYEQLGGLEGALTQTAEDAFTAIQKYFTDEPETIFARVMRELVAIDEQGKATRRVAPLSRFSDNVDDKLLVDTLLNSRLLTGYTAETSGSDKPEAVVNITHEALIHHWDRVQHWLEQDQELLQVRERIDQDCLRWQNESQRRDMLATSGKRLEDIRYLKLSGLQIDADTADFIDTSLIRAKQLQKRKRVLQASFSAISIAAAFFGVITLNSLDELSSQRDEVRAKEQILIKSKADSTALIAEAEYTKASLLSQQGNSSAALNSYFKAITRSRESGNIRRGQLAADEQQRDDENNELAPEWLIDLFRQPNWHLNAINNTNKLVSGRSFYPLVSPDKETALAIHYENDNSFATLLRLSDKKLLTAPLQTRLKRTQFNNFGATFTPDSSELALIVENKTAEEIRYSNKTYSIKLIDTKTGKFKTPVLTGIEDSMHLRFLNNNQLIISDNNSLRIWDGNQTNSFTNLNQISANDDLYIEKFDIINSKLVLINNKWLWQQQADGEWQNTSVLDDIDPFGSNVAKPNPIITKTGFINIVSSYDSWLPDWVLNIASLSLTNDYGADSWRNNWIKIQIKPRVAITNIAGDLVTTHYVDVPIPDELERSSKSYIHFPGLLSKQAGSDSILFLSTFLNFDNDENTYSYEIKLTDSLTVSQPQLILESKSYDFKLITGAAKINRHQFIFSASNGELFSHNSINNKVTTIRPASNIFSMVDLENNILLATDSGTYLLDKTLMATKNLTDEYALSASSRKVFSKYQYLYKTESDSGLFPKVYSDNDSDSLQIYRHQINPSRRGIKKPQINKPALLINDKSLNELGLLGSVIFNTSTGNERNKASILAASQLSSTNSTTDIKNEVISNGEYLSSKVKQVSIAPDAKHYTLLTDDDKLHILRMQDGAHLKTIDNLKSRVQKLATGNEYIASTSSTGKIDIINIKGNKRSSFTLKKIRYEKLAARDDGEFISDVNLQGTLSTLQWHPTQSVLATANWQGAVHLFPISNRRPTTRATASALHKSRAAITTLAWNPDGSILASGDRNGIVNLWTVLQGAFTSMVSAAQLKHDSGIVAVNFSTDGKWLVTATDTDKLYFWRADGTPLGKPITLQNIQVRDVLINEDNWGVVIISKAGKAYFVEAGDRFIPDRIIKYFDLLARDELFKQQASKVTAKDSNNILNYYQKPPVTDRTFWTAMVNRLILCKQHKSCHDSDSADNDFDISSIINTE